MTTEAEIIEAAATLSAAQTVEQNAKQQRIDCEDKLLKLVGHRVEGSRTTLAGAWKVITEGKLTRTVDQAAMAEVLPLLPDEQKAVTIKYALSVAGLRTIGAEYPEAAAILARAITTKPAKTSVKVSEDTTDGD